MKPIAFVGLAAVTVALGALYNYVNKSREESFASSKAGAAFFPELAEHVNDVATLRVETQDKSFEIRHEGKGWGLVSKNGYPVDASKVKTLLLALKDATPLEEKTSNPELYSKIGVQEPAAEGATSKRITALDGSGKELANLIVGSERNLQGGQSRSGAAPRDAYYVRKGGEPQSWLVEGKLAVEGDESYWLDRTILNVDRLRVRAAQVENADGERVFVSKASKEATNYDVAGLPEGRELRYAGIANTFGTALSNLTLDDVLPATDFVFSEPPTCKTTFWTFDGLRVDVQVEERDAKLYARFTTSFDDGGAEAAGAPSLPPAAEPEAAAEGEPAPPPVAEGPAPEEVRKEASELDQRLGAWVYVLPTWKKSSFMKRMEELLKELPAPGAEGEGEGLGGDAPELGEGFDIQSLLQGAMDGSGASDLLEDSSSGSEDGVVPPAEGGEEPKQEGGGEPPPPDDGGGG